MDLRVLVEQLRQACAQIVPDGCTVHVELVSERPDQDSGQKSMLVESWAQHRQNEFVTGRSCARRVLAELGFKGEASLEPDVDGVPIWPEGYVGSITHSRGVAAAIAASSDNFSLLGVDLEKTNRLTDAAIARVVHPLEEGFALGDQGKSSILFSLKEAFYKAQFPLYRTPGNFHDLVLIVDEAACRAQVMQIDDRFSKDLERAQFAYRVAGDYVLSLCWLS